VTAVIRHSGEKKAVPLSGLTESIRELLVEIHAAMYEK
jgi:hypothetical protein